MNASEPDPDFSRTLELVSHAQAGDREALGRLLARYQARVLQIVRIRLGKSLRSQVESRDILQETMLEAIGGIEKYRLREDASFLNWLARIVEHRIQRRAEYHGAAKRAAGQTLPLESLDSAALSSPPDSQSSPLSRMVDQEEREALLECLETLPARYREVLAMRDWVGASWESVARETGDDNANAARMSYARAKAALARKLRARRGP